MAYTKTTDFLAKDSLPLNDAGKYIKGSELDTEFEAMETADAQNIKNGGALGTPASGTLTNCTGLPAAGVSGTALVSAAIGSTVQAYDADLTTWAGVTPGTGVATALAANAGGSGGFQLYDADIPTVAASQVEMEAGTEAALRSMSPLRVAQAIAALVSVDSASQTQQEAASSDVVFVTPLVQQYHPSAPKAWARFDGTATGTNAPSKGYGVTSVTRTGTGAYTVNLSVTMSDALYAVVVSAPNTSNAGNTYYNGIAMDSQTTTTFTLAYAAGAGGDPSIVCFAVYGDI